MATNERIILLNIKLDRARKHINELQDEINRFLSTSPYSVSSRNDIQSQKLIYYVTKAEGTPSIFAVIIGDILHELRSTLDHLACQLVIIETNGQQIDLKNIAFPIVDDVKTYKDFSKPKLKGMHQKAINEIALLRPYKGGNDILWRLHKLNNIDKHRFLITVGAASKAVDLSRSIFRQLISSFDQPPNSNLSINTPFPELFFTDPDRQWPLKVGSVLFTDHPNTVGDTIEPKFMFEIAFGEPDVIKDLPIIQALQEMIDEVQNIINRFEPMLR